MTIREVKRASLYRYFQEWKKLRSSSTPRPGPAPSSVGQTSRSEKGGVLSRYEEFLRVQRLEIGKAGVLERAEASKASLRQAAEEYLAQGVHSKGWQRRHQLLEGRVEWVIRETRAASSEEALTALVGDLVTAGASPGGRWWPLVNSGASPGGRW